MRTAKAALPVLATALAALPAPALVVTGNNVTVSPASSHGPCPVTFTFRAKVALDKQGRFTYRWERSDKAVDTTPHAPGVFDGSHAVILETTWSLGAPNTAAFHPFHGWMKLHILTPEDRLSEPANITLDCGAPPPTLPPGALQRITPAPGGAQLPPPK
jgi:hypothetical protein